MSGEVSVYQGGGGLSLTVEQPYWTDRQLAALTHMGVDGAPEGDLAVFLHVCQRTGLDPFARQIYMIARTVWDDRTRAWVPKYTIQTGIDGYRLVGRRAADQRGHDISLDAPLWAHEDGSWRPVWSAKWGTPVAAKVVLRRAGQPFAAVALFDEYAQRKSNGTLTRVWEHRPAGQIAKCAEALAWRMAFPQDLAGLYTDDEMAHADADTPSMSAAAPSARPRGLAEVRADLTVRHPPEAPAVAVERAEVAVPDAQTVPGSDETGLGNEADSALEVPVEPVTSSQLKMLGTLMRQYGLTDRLAALQYVEGVVDRPIQTRNDLTKVEASLVIDSLQSDLAMSSTGEEPDLDEGAPL